MKKIKVILDTNVLISGIFWGGNPGKIISLWLNEKLLFCFSTETLADLIEKRIINFWSWLWPVKPITLDKNSHPKRFFKIALGHSRGFFMAEIQLDDGG